MRRKLFAGSSALLLIAVALLFILPGSRVFAANIGTVSSVTSVPVVTPTPDTAAAVNAANNAVSHTQDLLNIMGWFATILGVVLTLFTVFAVVIGFLGFRGYGEFSTLMKNLHANLAKIQAEADNTRSALVNLVLGDRLLDQRDKKEEAIKHYKEAGRLLPGDAQVQYVLGRIYSGAGEYETAINTLETAVKTLEATQSPDAVSLGNVEKELGLAYRRRGRALNREADYDAAVQHLRKAISFNSADSDAPAILGGLYRRKGEYALAYNEYERAWYLSRGSSYALGNLASLAWYEGKKDESRMYFGFAEVVATDRIKEGQSEIYWDYYDLGLAQLVLGKFTEAQKNYATAIKETPGKVQFEAVLDNLHLLQKAPQAMPGLDDIVKTIEAAEKEA